ncbi:MAG: mannose-1-phosphate guanylyltransferase/mannose-6-phosphate isomerase [Pseudomonadaceae bacterium]|nr:mannose-1-phosphate guanylyltransferase/mannose-6-phosphate isomerase [Pseudomonadaceae bacterium]
MSRKVRPVVLCGGMGSRLWPLSRKAYPKQFLSLIGEKSLFEATVERVVQLGELPPIIVCGEAHHFTVSRQIASLGYKDIQLIVEPVARDTAAAIALAAEHRKESDEILLVVPSDAYIADSEAFRDAVRSAADCSEKGGMVVFGVKPEFASTAYGYLQHAMGALDAPSFSVEKFVEKPQQDVAEEYFGSGRHLWNAGMFLFDPDTYLMELARHRPDIVNACEVAMASANHTGSTIRPSRLPLEPISGESVDYAVMERAANVTGVVLDTPWSDLGCFDAIGRIAPKDVDGNYRVGDVQAVGTSDSVILSHDRLVSVLGMSNVVVAETSDAVLVADRSRAQDVKVIVEALERDSRSESENHRKVQRPWGSYESLTMAPGFQVKRIVVDPGESLSLQSHEHRSEHWIVVKGLARVTKGEMEFDLEPNQSTYIEAGEIHRLANFGEEQVELVEVQVGAYLGEDDIKRYDDKYGRTA